MEFLSALRSWLNATFSASCLIGVLVLAGCVKYHPLPIDAPQVESDYRVRTLSDPGLQAYVEANFSNKPLQWPPAALDLPPLTLIAFYHSCSTEDMGAAKPPPRRILISGSPK